MQPAALPENETARLEKLRQYKILDTLPDESFDCITRLLSTILDVPIALVSLIDNQRQWFKSSVGLNTRETTRDVAFCSHAILQEKVFIVPDTALDPRFSDNPLVTGGPLIRFYAGVPLTTADGYSLGTLCGIDNKPRELSSRQILQLEDLAIIVMDAIELHRARLNAEQAEQAEADFLATMSHEIRAPLNGVLGLAQLLTDTKLNKSQRRKVDDILSSGEILVAIINDVLDLSKINAGGIELESHPFNLQALISTVTLSFDAVADAKRLKLHVVDSGEPLTISGDSLRLRQILWNLLSNAFKFTDAGSVTLTIADVEDAGDLVAGPGAHVLQFSVKDTGAGIAPERLNAIFGAYIQETSATTRKHGGTGLGLSIVKKLTELMGGTIVAKSQLGEGSEFTVNLPFDAATAEEANAISLDGAEDDNNETQPLNVLVAEDNDINAYIALAFLERLGHAGRRVENGNQAIAAANEGWAELILMDVHMPVMDGIDATKSIRSTTAGKNLPIIGLTADAFAQQHRRFKRAGMNDILTKPYTEKQLADSIATHRLAEVPGRP
ncbi:MAG: response regulator [Rhodospirillales bacterium]|nr:response regulator [Rhodospirillales bacterium]